MYPSSVKLLIFFFSVEINFNQKLFDKQKLFAPSENLFYLQSENELEIHVTDTLDAS